MAEHVLPPRLARRPALFKSHEDEDERTSTLADVEAPAGWMGMWHPSGQPCYVHLKSKVCIWSPPYCVQDSTNIESHAPPGAIRKALLMQRASSEAKRQRSQQDSGPPYALTPAQPRARSPASESREPPLASANAPPAAGPPPGAPSTTMRNGDTHYDSSMHYGGGPAIGGGPTIGSDGGGGGGGGWVAGTLWRRPATLPSRLLPGTGPNGQKRAFHPGCPCFDIDITDKSPASILNEAYAKELERTQPQALTYLPTHLHALVSHLFSIRPRSSSARLSSS